MRFYSANFIVQMCTRNWQVSHLHSVEELNSGLQKKTFPASGRKEDLTGTSGLQVRRPDH